MQLNNSNGTQYDDIVHEFQISAAAAQGGRKYMEDRVHIEVVRSEDKLELIFAAVYDGHGGVYASDYACRHLFANIICNQGVFSDDDQAVMEAIRTGFSRTHADMHKVAEHWPPTSTGFFCTAGTTATCIIIRNGRVFTGHVGDSSIILANFAEDEAGYNDAKLTEDHKPESKSEYDRIEKAGGVVASKSGISRIVWKRPIRGHRGPVRRSTTTENIPFLAVARSLGDFWSYNPDTKQFVVSPEPDVDVFRLKSNDNFLVLASDGLTNVVGVHAIIQNLREVDQANREAKTPVNYAHSLLQNAFKKWGSLRADNISAICIKLNAEKIEPDDPAIVEEDPDMEICKQLTEHPFSMVHISQTNTFRLASKPIRHMYTGTLDRGMDVQTMRFGRTVNGNGEIERKSSQQNQSQGFFAGPGFIVPDMPKNDNDDFEDEMAAATTDSANSCFGATTVLFGEGNNKLMDNIDRGSDQEEAAKNAVKRAIQDEADEKRGGNEVVKQPNEVAHLAGSSSSSAQNDDDDDQQQKKRQHKVPIDEGKTKHPIRNRVAGVKRRFQDNEDGYVRHVPSHALAEPASSSSSSGGHHNLKVCLEEEQQEDEDEVKPPPAKRSKIQSVLNFFTNLFKW